MNRIIMLLLTLSVGSSLYAEPLTGLQVVEKAKQNGKGFQDLLHEVKMLLVDDSGDVTEREMLMKAKTDSNGDSYSMLICP